MTQQTLVFVPGLWEGTAPFDAVTKSLQTYGYPTVYAPLVSTGCASPGNPTLLDDVAHIRSVIKSLVEESKEVILVGHSAGGSLGAAAIKGLSVKERSEAGKKGGVTKLVFLSAMLVPAGFRHPDVLEFFDIQVLTNLSHRLLSSQIHIMGLRSFFYQMLKFYREIRCTAKIL